MAYLDVKGICKRFGNTPVLSDVSFTMEKGQILSLIGSSGSGKTTLLRCLNFLEIADKGTISVNGQLLFDGVQKLNEKAIRANRLHFGLVFQSFNLFPQYTVLKNITLAPTLLKTAPADEIREKALVLLDRVGLKNKMNSYPGELSGGQQQRVAIARALALSPDILCFDEPTSALDPELTGEVLSVIKDLASQHMTMLIVTHEMAFARDVSDYVLFMADKGILEEGTPEELFGNPKTERLRSFLSAY